MKNYLDTRSEVNHLYYVAKDLTDEQFNNLYDELKVWLREYYNYDFPNQYIAECIAGEGDMRHIVEAAADFYRKGLKAASVIVAS